MEIPPVEFKIEKQEEKYFRLIAKAAASMNYPVYAVGGYVRDRILGCSSNEKDIDIVCVGDGISLAEEFAQLLPGKPKVNVFKRFGTAMVRTDDMEIEFVGARKESYSESSRKPAVSDGSLRDDQLRRDFTINALALSLNESDYGNVIDPFDGLKHMEQKLIMTPLDPDRTFSDDPLRMMRAIRFATQLNFEIHEQTLQSISDQKNRISIVSAERITIELNKIMSAEKPSIGFKLLFDTGLLHLIFPEMVALQGVDIVDGIGHKDNFYHTLEVLDNTAEMSDDPWLRWAAILHDIAKPPTKKFEPGIGWTFHGHEVLGAAMVPRIFKKLKLPLDHKMKYVQKLVRLHLRPITLTKEEITDSAVRRLLFDAGDDIDDLMTLVKADITSKNPAKVDRYHRNYEVLKLKLKEVEEKDKLRNWQPPVSGEDIIRFFNLKPGPTVGILKTAIREAILDGDIANDREAAVEFMKKKGAELGLQH
jgi:poly(A) polymerase